MKWIALVLLLGTAAFGATGPPGITSTGGITPGTPSYPSGICAADSCVADAHVAG